MKKLYFIGSGFLIQPGYSECKHTACDLKKNHRKNNRELNTIHVVEFLRCMLSLFAWYFKN